MDLEEREELTPIENTEAARENYGYHFGASEIILTVEDLLKLLEGKCLAAYDGEYSTFISLDKKMKVKILEG